jgi:N-acetylmuramoyl-L-alanine amidase
MQSPKSARRGENLKQGLNPVVSESPSGERTRPRVPIAAPSPQSPLGEKLVIAGTRSPTHEPRVLPNPKRSARSQRKPFGGKRILRYKIRMPRPISCVLAIALLASLGACATQTGGVKNTSKTFTTVVVDAGHGGKDSGAYRRSGPPEKVVALDVAQRLERKLRESQLQTVMIRSSDVFIPLDERVAIENSQKNAIFVSIHFNDARKRGIRGVETYYHSGASSELANRIQAKLMIIPHSGDRGVHTANFRVLRMASYPAVLVECGFLSNRADGKQARDWEYRELLADRIAEAIVEQRYGPGVYQPSGRLAAQLQPATTGPAGPTPPAH